MSAYLSPVGNSQESDANGAPLSGGLIYSYAAGTSTPIATYTGSDGLTAQANPVVLNASGLPDSPIWLPAGQAVKLVVKDSTGVTLRTVDNLTGINDPAGIAAASEWVTYTGEPTYISATSFSVEGDQTNVFQVGRRVKSTNTGGTVYSTISASSYSAGSGLTTVTVTNDSGTLDSGLSAAAYGLLSVTTPSIPVGATQIQGGTATALSGTSVDFDIPSWVKRITISYTDLSTNGTSEPIVQIGDSGGFETSGYAGATTLLSDATAVSVSQMNAGFLAVYAPSAASVIQGRMTLVLVDPSANTWTAEVSGAFTNIVTFISGFGRKSLSGTLDRVRLTMTNGADTFDAGKVSVLYE